MMFGGWPQTKLMRDMTSPELDAHITKQMQLIKSRQTADVAGFMLVIFRSDGIAEYGSTIDPKTAPKALRQLADKIEGQQTFDPLTP